MEQHRYEENKVNNNINLEDAVEIEKQITKISESLRSEIDPTMDCEDWWMVTDPSNYTLNKLSSFFKNENVVKAIIQAQKLETIAISFLQFLSFDGSLDKLLWGPFKNLMFFVHQNSLVQFKFLLERLPSTTKVNSWAVRLEKI